MTAPTLPISDVVNVKIEMSPTAAALRNFGACLIIGTSDVIDTQERIRAYSDITTVAQDFGVESKEYLAAQAFFSQTPKPSVVQIGRWAKSATAGRLRGRVLSTSEQNMDAFAEIETGSISFAIDGKPKSLSSIDLSSETNLNGVASQVTSALSGSGTCRWTGTQFVVTSSTTGETSSVTCNDEGQLAQLLGLNASATSVKGSASEKLVEALTVLTDFQGWYMACLADKTSDEEMIAAAGLIEAASPARMIGFTTQNTLELDSTRSDTLGAKLKALGYNRTVVMYSSSSEVAVASIFGRMSTVNFEGSNTCITLKFKQCPGGAAENLRISQANTLKAHNVNVFAAYQNDTSILREGITAGGWFIDETHGLDWLQNRVETDLWNLLYTSKKVGQDEIGADNLVATVSKSLEQGVKNWLIAPGVWNGDSFGALKTGDTLATGYYVYIQPFDEQSQSDREARKAPPIQIAVKLKGAIHFVDCTITVNR